MTYDVIINDQGSIVLFTPMTERATLWWQGSVDYEDWQKIGAAFGVERRMAHAIYIGLIEAQFDLLVE